MTMTSLGDRPIEKERYSFSKLKSFLTCRYGYKFTYIDHIKGESNCFSSYGTEVHSILERYAKGELTLEALPGVYEWEFDSAVSEKFPPSKFCPDMRQLYYEQGLEFLKGFTGYPEYKILDVEKSFEIDIDDWVFNGVIDLILEDSDGNLIIQDYKSKASFKNKGEQHEYARQLYLYSLFVKEHYGRPPTDLRFYMFRKGKIINIPYKEEDLIESVNWAKDVVKEIRECWDYYPSCESFYGNQLCNHRSHCDKLVEE